MDLFYKNPLLQIQKFPPLRLLYPGMEGLNKKTEYPNQSLLNTSRV